LEFARNRKAWFTGARLWNPAKGRKPLTLIRHYFEAAQAMSPTAVGNGTLP